jgi:hypothetical protein
MIALSAALAALIVLAFVGLVAVSLRNQSIHDIWR